MDIASTAATPAALLRVLAGGWITQAVYISAKLGVADLLQAQPRSCNSLAECTRTHPHALYRVLRALASVGIFHEDENRCFRLTPMADHLRTDAPGSLRAFAIMLGEREHWRAWEGLMHSVQTGNCAFEQVFGMPHFEYFERHPESGRVFDAAMTSRSGSENQAIIAAYDFAMPEPWSRSAGDKAAFWKQFCASIAKPVACFSILPKSSPARATAWRRRNSRPGASSWQATSSRPSRVEGISTSSRKSSTTGMTSAPR